MNEIMHIQMVLIYKSQSLSFEWCLSFDIDLRFLKYLNFDPGMMGYHRIVGPSNYYWIGNFCFLKLDFGLLPYAYSKFNQFCLLLKGRSWQHSTSCYDFFTSILQPFDLRCSKFFLFHPSSYFWTRPHILFHHCIQMFHFHLIDHCQNSLSMLRQQFWTRHTHFSFHMRNFHCIWLHHFYYTWFQGHA